MAEPLLAELPAGIADVEVRVLDPAGEVLAEAALRSLERVA